MKWFYRVAAIPLVLTLVACSDGSPTQNASGADPTFGCDGNCTNSSLTVDEVQTIIAQSVGEAQSLDVEATIAVVDRVGNVLAVYRMGEASNRSVLVTTDQDRDLNNDGIVDIPNISPPRIDSGLEGIELPAPAGPLQDSNLDHFAAIAKAVTGAYLSSQGNAFTSRTANQIVQDHFNPGEDFQPGGPLFGVQFSQLACSDFIQPANVAAPAISIGPRSSPLGLSADPGGFPLYKNGDVVGGIGVMADSIYGIDTFIADSDNNLDELIALAGSFGFGAPVDRRERITVEGKIFRFSDVDFENLTSNPEDAPAFNSIPASVGQLIDVSGYTGSTIRAGTTFGTASSGIRADDEQTFDPSLDAFVFVDDSNQPRFEPQNGNDVGDLSLTADEVTELLEQALGVANSARAQIRRPLSTPARVTISVVDTQGNILGIVRGRDAPVFGADVSLQKARTAAFFSSTSAASYLQNTPAAAYVRTPDPSDLNPDDFIVVPIGSYVTQLQDFLENPDALTPDGFPFAFSDRAGGNLSRPFFPDGINGTDAGPLSKPAGEWSVFSSGLQLDLSYNAILAHAALLSGTADSPRGCAGQPGVDEFARGLFGLPLERPEEQPNTDSRLANGLQIFPGSVPIYRGSTLIGGIGVSGDGIDQDDMIAFLGLSRAGEIVDINNAPLTLRADNLTPQGTRLRYVQCPQAPFLNSTTESVCDGL